jgi:cation diffusion facilitator family transporter
MMQRIILVNSLPKSFFHRCYAPNKLSRHVFPSLSFQYGLQFRLHSTHNHGHTHGHGNVSLSEINEKRGVRITLIGLGSNIGFAIVKGAAGVFYQSASLIADALHQASDIVADGVTLVAFRMGRKEPDNSHPFGFGRYEQLGSLAVSLLLLGAAGGTALYSVDLLHILLQQKAIHAHGAHAITPAAATTIGQGAFWIMVSSIVVKEWLFRKTLKLGQELKSPVLEANAWHHRSDSASSLVALIGIGGSMMGIPAFDPVGGLLVAGMIAKYASQIGLESLRALADASIPDAVIKDVESAIRTVQDADDNLVSFHSLRGRSSGSAYHADLILVVQRDISVSHAHAIAEMVREAIKKAVPNFTEISIHVDTQESQQHDNPNTPTSDLQDSIDNIVKTRFPTQIKSLSHIRVHYLNGVHIELDMTLQDDGMKVSEARQLAKRVKSTILQEMPEIQSVDVHLEFNVTDHLY